MLEHLSLARPSLPSSQADGHADQDDAYQLALEALARALMRAVAARLHEPEPNPAHLLPMTRDRFGYFAALAVALCDPSVYLMAKREAILDVIDDDDPLSEQAHLARTAIQCYEARLHSAAATAVVR